MSRKRVTRSAPVTSSFNGYTRLGFAPLEDNHGVMNQPVVKIGAVAYWLDHLRALVLCLLYVVSLGDLRCLNYGGQGSKKA